MSKIGSIAAAVLALSAFGAQAGLVIDDFSVSQAFTSDTTLGDGGVMVAQAGPSASIIGGYRDLYIETLTSASPTDLNGTIGVAGGSLFYSQDSSVGATGIVRWDGISSTMAPDVDGLTTAPNVGVDLAAGGVAIRVQVIDADLNFPLTLDVWSFDGTSYTKSSQTKFAVAGPGVYDFTFASFAGANFSNVGALQLVLNNLGTVAALDIQIDIVSEVPEPGSLALAGLALAGLGLARRRKVASR